MVCYFQATISHPLQALHLSTLTRKHTPGFQFGAKIEGSWVGIVLLIAIPTAFSIYTYGTHGSYKFGGFQEQVYATYFFLLVLNFAYTLIIDHFTWLCDLQRSANCGVLIQYPNVLIGSTSGLMTLSGALLYNETE
ncbi:hypothetical protein H072_842 [Dactylellina haptotyla CBS 200.50]|uniref:Uncharacterized protein n=1 Tax=Dactylellina haptotyla (strain CBS 200.50) TaxID=1284197 RepID=S8AQF0_DACHA|nr:hypothetical protein H072_842 [Dactylellina haptotyla CBS 200.50]